MNIELITHGILIGWFLANFGPLQSFLSTYIKPKVKDPYLKTLLSCFVCLSFWSTAIISLCTEVSSASFYNAAAAGLFAYTYERIINSFKIYL